MSVSTLALTKAQHHARRASEILDQFEKQAKEDPYASTAHSELSAIAAIAGAHAATSRAYAALHTAGLAAA